MRAALQDAGAAAIELNIYYLPGDPPPPTHLPVPPHAPFISGSDVERRHVEILTTVKAVVTVPVAVKLSPYFSSTGEMARRLDRAGADGLVLFNRFLQPDIDPETLTVTVRPGLSSPGRGTPSPDLDRTARRARARLPRRDHRRRDRGRRGQLPARRRGCGDDRVGAAPPRARVRGRNAGRAVGLDGPQGLRLRRRSARPARRPGRHRPGGLRARGICHRAGGCQQGLRPLVAAGIWEGRRGGIRAAGLPGRPRYPRAACPESATSWLSLVRTGPWGAISASGPWR